MIARLTMIVLSVVYCGLIIMMGVSSNLGVLIRFIIPGILLCCTSLLLVACHLYLAEQKKVKKVKKNDKEKDQSLSVNFPEFPEEFVIMRDVTCMESIIDFIVIGPSGIFVVETNDLRGGLDRKGNTILLNGKRQISGYLDEAKKKTENLRTVFKMFGGTKRVFKPVLCFTEAYVNLMARGEFDGVLVVSMKDIKEFLVEAPQVLDSFDIYRSYKFLDSGIDYRLSNLMNRMDLSGVL